MGQRRIALVTNLSRPWKNGWYYKAGFESNGHVVLPINSEDYRQAPGNVLDPIREFGPDFIIYTKKELPVDVLKKLKPFGMLIQWYPDPVIPEWLPPYVETADLFLTMAEGLVERFREINPDTHFLSQGFEPSFFVAGEITQEDRKAFSSDVASVGNLGSKPQYLTRRQRLTRVMEEGFSLKWWGPPLPRKLSTIPLMLGRLGRAYGGRFVWGREYAKVARLSKVFLAFDSLPHLRKSMSARMYTAVGCGAFYLCTHVDGIEDVLVPGKEIETFTEEDEMIEKIRHYAGNEDERKRMAEAGRERVLRDHTYEVRTRELLEIAENAL